MSLQLFYCWFLWTELLIRCSSFLSYKRGKADIAYWGTKRHLPITNAETVSTKITSIFSNAIVSSSYPENTLKVLRSIPDENPEVVIATYSSKGKVPRSYLPSFLVLREVDVPLQKVRYSFELALQWYLDASGKLNSLHLVPLSSRYYSFMEEMGFTLSNATFPTQSLNDFTNSPSKPTLYIGNYNSLISYCDKMLMDMGGQSSVAVRRRTATLLDIKGRLLHEINQIPASIDAYTQSLLLLPNISSTLRNLGSAYHAEGKMQMAFAAYQQAMQLDPHDALIYLKLAFFYEEYAKKDWENAGIQAEKCYRYYLEQVDPEDTSILLRLGNLLLLEGNITAALDVYEKLLEIDSNCVSAWFNRAHAQLKLDDYTGAKDSLQISLKLDPTLIAARHMLNALDESRVKSVRKMDPEYVRVLFDQYASKYEEHGKKLLYSAPRIIRQELAKVYRDKLGHRQDASFLQETKEQNGSCTSYVSFMNNSLDILDLGCGTGLIGAWLKDFAKYLVGVDLSSEMVEVAKKKMIYQELIIASIEKFLCFPPPQLQRRTFDLVVAAEVFSYIGDLSEILSKISNFISDQGLFVYTVESLDSRENEDIDSNYLLTKSGRFAYKRRYFDELLDSTAPFKIIRCKEFSLRMDNGEPVPGYLFILQKHENEGL